MATTKKSSHTSGSLVWRPSASIRGYRIQLQTAINASEDGAYAQVDLTTARALVEICKQAEHTEEGHGL